MKISADRALRRLAAVSPAASNVPVVWGLVISESPDVALAVSIGSGTSALCVAAGLSVRESTIEADVVSLVSPVTGILAWCVGEPAVPVFRLSGISSVTEPGSFCMACWAKAVACCARLEAAP